MSDFIVLNFDKLTNKLDRCGKMSNNACMTTQEIKQILEDRGLSISGLAEELGINNDNLGRILAGKRPLTEQLARHIEYVLGVRKSQLMVFNVELPEGEVQRFVPGWDKLSPEEQRKAALAVARNVLRELIENGRAALTPEELEELRLKTGGGSML